MKKNSSKKPGGLRGVKTKRLKKYNLFIYASIAVILIIALFSFTYMLKNSKNIAGEAVMSKFSSRQKGTISQPSPVQEKKIIWTDPAQYKTSSNTWTEAIQMALDSSKYVRLSKNQGYEVVNSGQKFFNSVPYDYSLSIPSGANFDLNGATLKLADGQNAIILINKNPGNDPSSMDSKIKIFRGILDGNEQKQTIENAMNGDVSVIEMIGVNGLELKDLTVKNALQYFGRMLKVDDGKFVNLMGTNSRGDGWSFGIASLEVSHSQLDNITATDVKGNFDLGKGELHKRQGNPIIGAITDSKIGKLVALQSNAGIKIQDTSRDLVIDSIYFEASKEHSPNCGLKIQGDISKEGLYPVRIAVNKVVVKNCAPYGTSPAGAGLYLHGFKNVTINSYEGFNNGGYWIENNEPMGYPAVWIDNGQGLKINSLRSENCQGSCVSIRLGASDYWIGKIEIINPIESTAQGINVQGGPGRIEQVTEIDNRIDALERRLINVPLDSTNGSIGKVITNFGTIIGGGIGGAKMWIDGNNNNFTIDSYQEGASKTEGSLLIPKNSLSTDVNTNIVFSQFTNTPGKYLRPTITLFPISKTSKLSSSQIEFKDSSAGKGFTIKHPKLDQDETIYWKASGWKVVEVK